MTDRKARAKAKAKARADTEILRFALDDGEKQATATATATASATATTGVLRFAQDDRYIVNKYKEATYYLDSLYTSPAQIRRVNNF
jgi:hypothetical protein